MTDLFDPPTLQNPNNPEPEKTVLPVSSDPSHSLKSSDSISSEESLDSASPSGSLKTENALFSMKSSSGTSGSDDSGGNEPPRGGDLLASGDDPRSIIPVNIEEEMKRCYLDYAMSVIVSRAIPDSRDGLKPVHRRIIYRMYEMGLLSDRPAKKAGRVVGDVLGFYHPHGDAAIYESLVRLAQNFSLLHPLIQGQGNFGSIDGDPPAAMRYTEARMSKIADEMIRDIQKNTVNYVPNYDGSVKEPVVLPTAFPFLIVNGASGIAVGMATNLAPHNLIETCNAIVGLLENPEMETHELFHKHIFGPDFPTGAIIYGHRGIGNYFEKGRGSVLIRSKHHIETSKTKETLVFTEIPYMVNKSLLMDSIAILIRDKKIEGISDLRDESDRKGIRIICELKRNADAEIVLNQLFSQTSLQKSFHINNLALVKGAPQTLSMKRMLTEFIEHRKEVISRRTVFDLEEAQRRLHILEGLAIALASIEEVIRVIKSAPDTRSARAGLQEAFLLSEEQSQAILDMRLQRLTSLEVEKIQNEIARLREFVAKCQFILSNPSEIVRLIKEETLELKNKHGIPRRTQILGNELEKVEDYKLVSKEDMVVMLSQTGYIKRLSMSNYRTQNRGGKGIFSSASEDDTRKMLIVNTHATLLYITSRGRAYSQKAFELPESSKNAKGKHIRTLIDIQEDEEIMAIVSLDDYEGERFIVMATSKGLVVRINTHHFRNARKKGILAIDLEESDFLVAAKITTGNNELFFISKKGYGLRYNESLIRQTRRNAKGVRSLRLRPDDSVADVIVFRSQDEQVLLITEKGYGKRVDFSEFKEHGRGTMGQITYRITPKTGKIVKAVFISNEHDIICTTKQSKTIKLDSQGVSLQGRTAQGVRVFNLQEDDSVVSIDYVMKTPELAEEEKGSE